MKTRPVQRNPKIERRRRIKRLVIVSIAGLAILASIIFISRAKVLSVEGVDLVGQKTLIEDDVRMVVDEYLDGHLLWVLPRRNVLVLSTGAIKHRLTDAFPRIEDIDVHIDGGDRIVVSLGERSAHSLWCVDQDYEHIFEEDCYFADTMGLLYARAPYFSGSVYLKVYFDPVLVADEEGEVSNLVGQRVTQVPDFDEFFTFLSDLESSYPVVVKSVHIDAFGDVYLVLSRVLNYPYQDVEPVIIYHQGDDYETILRNVGVVFDFPEFDDTFTSTPSWLESIDVRFDGRAFYTFVPPSSRITSDEPDQTTEEDSIEE